MLVDSDREHGLTVSNGSGLLISATCCDPFVLHKPCVIYMMSSSSQ
jgi:hypothetical protein